MKIRSTRFALKRARSLRLVTCKACNGFGGHHDGYDIQECGACDGQGEVVSP